MPGMGSGFLGEDRVGRMPRADRGDHELLGQVVGLGHDVADALVGDPLESLIAVHEDRPRLPRETGREREIVGRAAGDRRDGLGAGRHGPVQVTARG